MAITNAWSIDQMKHLDADGGVFQVNWSLTAKSDGDPSYSATSAGKLVLEPDASDPGYIPYADLTESIVLGWVYNSLIEGEETADQAKARVEVNRTAKVQGQIDTAATEEDGVPWSTPEESLPE